MAKNSDKGNIILMSVLVAFRLEGHSRYAKLMEKHMNTYMKELKEKEFKTLGDGIVSFFDYSLVNIYYPQILRYSLFLSLIAVFEYSMIEICEILKSKYNLSVDVRDLRGENPDTFRRYITKVVKYPFPEKSNSWIEIRHYYRARHFIIHRFGKLDKSTNAKGIRKHFKKGKILIKDNNIVFLKNFEQGIIDTMLCFFEELFENFPEFNNMKANKLNE